MIGLLLTKLKFKALRMTMKVSSSCLLPSGERNTKPLLFAITMMIGKLIKLLEIIPFILLTTKLKNGFLSTTQSHKMSSFSANNSLKDYGHLTNVKPKSTSQSPTIPIFTTTINTHNRSQLIQDTLPVLPVTEVKFSC